MKYSFLIGIFLFAIILLKIDLGGILQNIKEINPLFLILAMLAAFPILLNKALCWNYIKTQQGIKYSLKDSFLMYCAGLYIGVLTPGRLGEATKVLYLKNDGHSLGKALVGVVLDRITDFAFFLFVLLIGSLFLISVLQKQVLILIAGILVLVCLFIVFLKIGLIKWGINKAFRAFIPRKYQKSWKINFQDFIADLKIYKLRAYVIMMVITALSSGFYYLQMYILARGMNMDIPFLYLAVSVTIAGLVTLIPVSISGIGTRDAALILLLSPLGILKEQAVVFSALILIMALIATLIGLICWLIKPLRA
ncbi:MAG: lysylphosphatidylglycerol synthase transmembrane domain-containing protein [Patescibacteria group bacterium]